MTAPMVLTPEQVAPQVEFNLVPVKDGHMGDMFGDLATAQGEFEPIEKNQTARIMKDGRLLYEFHYADMGEITKKTTPALSKHGIGVTSIPTIRRASDGGHVLRTMLVHKSGSRMESILVIPQKTMQNGKESDVKDFGGYITYLRRYQVSAMLNIAADADLDSSQQPEGDDEEEGGAPRIGSVSPTSAPKNAAEFPPLNDAKTIGELSTKYGALSEPNKDRYRAHYERRLGELDKARGKPVSPEPIESPADAGGF